MKQIRRKSGLPTDMAYFHSPTVSRIEESNAHGFHGAATEQTELRAVGFDLGPMQQFIIVLQAVEASTSGAVGVLFGCCCVHVWQKDGCKCGAVIRNCSKYMTINGPSQWLPKTWLHVGNLKDLEG